MPGFLFDANVWVAAVFPTHPGNAVALEALARASAAQPAVMCRAIEQSFLRLVTTPVLFNNYGMPGMTNAIALQMLDLLKGAAHVATRDESPGVTPRWRQLATLPSPSPKRWMDAYLAAFAIASGLSLVTFDKDFMVFSRHGLDCNLLTV